MLCWYCRMWQWNNQTWEKKKIKKKELPNVTKEQWHMMLVLHNARMEPSNVREKREPLNATKVLSNVMLVLSNVTME